MINLKLRTEYSFRKAYGPIPKVIAASGGDALGIADNGTWGHIPFLSECLKQGKKPILGIELPVVDTLDRVKQPNRMFTLIPKNDKAFGRMNRIVETAYNNFYYMPRLSHNQALEIDADDDFILLTGPFISLDRLSDFNNIIIELSVANLQYQKRLLKTRFKAVVVNDQYYPIPEDKIAYDILTGRNAHRRTQPCHIMSEAELRSAMPWVSDSAFSLSEELAELVNINKPVVDNVKFPEEQSLHTLCMEGFKRKNLKPTKEYLDRMEYELQLIRDKDFKDYFLVIADMIMDAKKTMLVGPSRGSSAGSLVCFLMGITEVDPILHDLMFERFIDVTRLDMPDIDIDFPDVKRKKVIKYLKDKYGADKVAHIGTVSRYKARSTIVDVSKEFGIPVWESKDVKDAMIERDVKDSRASFCIQDTFKLVEAGQKYIEKFPEMSVACDLENHARHTGTHAAGIIVCNKPVTDYCAIDPRDDVATIDKRTAEDINILKIDVLGLRTLSVLEEACKRIGMKFHELYSLPLNDKKAFDIINSKKFSGIFQFEGDSLKTLSIKMGINSFDDISAITSLARPGPLKSGGANDFVNRRIGNEEVSYLHETCKKQTKETYGVIVFQEQVIQILRDVGQLNWKDTNALRKAFSKSYGEEYFDGYWDKFKKGALDKGLKSSDAKYVWDHIKSFGKYAFNKSHAVSYAIVSYWCMYLKAHWPLEFALSCLVNSKDSDQTVKLLRELVNEGYKYKPWDMELSDIKWSINDGVIVGGFTNVKGIGLKTAQEIVTRRKNNIALTEGQLKKLGPKASTPFDNIFPTNKLYGDYYNDPKKYKIFSGSVSYIRDMQANGEYIFIGQAKECIVKDVNEYFQKKKIERLKLFLNLIIEDDTDTIRCTINRYDYPKLGKNIKEGDWLLIRGEIKNEWRKVYIKNIRLLSH